jgi:hypothetical protein
MKVFIAVRVHRAAPELEEAVDAVLQAVKAEGHTALVAYREIARYGLSPSQFMPYVKQEISTSDLIIVVYSADLRGGLIELGIAYAFGIPIWLVVRRGEQVSSSALASAIRIIDYADSQELEQKIMNIFCNGEL